MHRPEGPRLILLPSLLLLLLCGSAFSQDISSKYASALLNVTMTWTVSSDVPLDDVDLEVFIPENSPNQDVLAVGISELYEIKDGKLHVTLHNITTKDVRGSFLVRTDYLSRINRSAPSKVQLAEYLNETKLVVVTRKIAAQAGKFPEAFPDKLVEMSRWVYDNIEYAMPYSDVDVSDIYQKTLSSDWVFENRTGVCDEFAHLFIAFARAVDVPARVVSGFVLVGERWIPHSWAEVYIEQYGWIEIDPTFNEFMNLDAMRLRIGSGIDQSVIADRVNATSRKNAEKLGLSVDTKIDVINYSKEADLSLDVRFPPQEQLSPTQPVLIRIVNNANVPVFTALAVALPRDVTCNCTTYLFLEPGKLESHVFTLQLPALSPNVRYVFPITVFTDYSQADSSFSRMQITEESRQPAAEEETSENLRYFIGIFLMAMIGLIVIAILRGW